jgi:transposase InsO family protein
MKKNENAYEIVFMSNILSVSRQGYYRYVNSLEKPYKYELLLAEMLKIIAEDECNDTYGSMRMWEALQCKKSLGDATFPHIPHERTVYRIMKEHGLIHAVKHTPNGITKADKKAQKSDDLIKRDFTAEKPLTKAITDITELPTADGKLYISCIFDCYDLLPIGLAMADNMRAQLCEKTIESLALKYGKAAIKGLVAHSDRGSQYTSELYRNAIRKYEILQSMNSAAGKCHDNARCEAIWGRMKEELIYGRYNTKKMSMEAVKSLVWRYFMGYWSNRRICSAIGGIPPAVKRRRYYESLESAA